MLGVRAAAGGSGPYSAAPSCLTIRVCFDGVGMRRTAAAEWPRHASSRGRALTKEAPPHAQEPTGHGPGGRCEEGSGGVTAPGTSGRRGSTLRPSAHPVSLPALAVSSGGPAITHGAGRQHSPLGRKGPARALSSHLRPLP